VLAAVTIGVYMGWYTPQLTTVETRLSGDAFWEILVFLVNALLFALVGLQLHAIVDRLSVSTERCSRDAAASRSRDRDRLVWVPIFTYVPRLLFRASASATRTRRGRRRRHRVGRHPRRRLARGGARAAGDVPGRDLIVFLTFASSS
jgi:NhaP-type Na+/H+ or K+/H+ antiporter